MDRSRIQTRRIVTSIACYLLIGSLLGRSLPKYSGTPYFELFIWLVAAYTLLFTTDLIISRALGKFAHLYLALQVLIILALEIIIPPFDYFTILIIPLCIQAFWTLPQRTASIWAGILGLVSYAALVESYGWLEGSGYAMAYLAVLFFISVFTVATNRAEQARAESQALLVELQAANRRLEEYADRVEDLAAAQERTLLARELHDSVTQTIFSMTLTAQAARILLDRDPPRVAVQLDRLQDLAQNALSEMRSLIQQMRPRSIDEEGLVAALRKHFTERQKKDGLTVDFALDGDRRLPVETEAALFRIVQEALNNIVKHAQTNQARVVLCLDRDPIFLAVEDHGSGFDPALVRDGAVHLGLKNMADRVQALGGALTVESHPGTGTRVTVEDISVKEKEHV